MSSFNNVSITKKANVYFDGKVTSRNIEFEDGTKKSLGIMQVGEYRFNTDSAEVMEIIGGEIEVKLADEDEFVALNTPCRFEVPKNSYFDIRVKSLCDYICTYI